MISDYREYRLSKREKVMLFSAGYAAIFLVSLLFYHSIPLALACGFLALFLEEPYGEYKAEKRRDLLLLQFKDLLYCLAAAFASGRQMKQALIGAHEDLLLLYQEDTPMISELRYMIRGMMENRQSEEELLSDFARRSNLEDIRNFVDVYRACRITGGDMEKVIASVTDVLMDKMAIEREIKALTSQKMFEGRIISLMPLLVVLFLNIFSPDYLAVMYETAQGRILMTLALLGIFWAYKMTMKMAKVEV